MADWFIATEGVKVVKDSASLWPQIITSVSSIAAAVGAVFLTHQFTRRREERAAEAKLASERFFIGTELICLLEHFADQCSDVVCETEPGKENWTVKDLPLLSLEGIEGDWRSLPAEMLFRLRNLPALNREARYVIEGALRYGAPYEVTECARYQYACLGLKVLLMAWRLRRICDLPPPREGELCRRIGSILWRNRRALWRRHVQRQRQILNDQSPDEKG
ncbi:hypothetical protein SG82_17550 [Enterobacter hormaechei subsp. xiangfangensis]|uniref:hypothetical protein n=1 Tax=Enterobacter hormaechei TaxID=158836 RepID=UPI0005F905EC|nr:hypothetical protein [Enterobacter hormaechei]KJX20721.1 hypothetical protein SG82_17550 [Enterobacter hormaechei subsp. xiangfangensis]